MTPGKRRVFTSSEAARYLGVTQKSVQRWSDAGHLPHWRTPGGQRRFARDELDRFIDSRRHPHQSPHPHQPQPKGHHEESIPTLTQNYTASHTTDPVHHNPTHACTNTARTTTQTGPTTDHTHHP